MNNINGKSVSNVCYKYTYYPNTNSEKHQVCWEVIYGLESDYTVNVHPKSTITKDKESAMKLCNQLLKEPQFNFSNMPKTT